MTISFETGPSPIEPNNNDSNLGTITWTSISSSSSNSATISSTSVDFASMLHEKSASADNRPVLDPNNPGESFSDTLATHNAFLDWNDPLIADRFLENSETSALARIETFSDIPSLESVFAEESTLLELYDGLDDPRIS